MPAAGLACRKARGRHGQRQARRVRRRQRRSSRQGARRGAGTGALGPAGGPPRLLRTEAATIRRSVPRKRKRQRGLERREKGFPPTVGRSLPLLILIAGMYVWVFLAHNGRLCLCLGVWDRHGEGHPTFPPPTTLLPPSLPPSVRQGGPWCPCRPGPYKVFPVSMDCMLCLDSLGSVWIGLHWKV